MQLPQALKVATQLFALVSAMGTALWAAFSGYTALDGRIAALEKVSLTQNSAGRDVASRLAAIERAQTLGKGAAGPPGPKGDPGPQADTKVLEAQLASISARLQKLEAASPLVASRSPSTEKQTGRTVVQSVLPQGIVQEAGGLRFELDQCKKSGGSVTCRIYITAATVDLRAIFCSGNAVDAEGAVYQFRGYQGAGEKELSRPCVTREYISGVRVAATLSFEGTSDARSNSLALLRFGGRIAESNREVQFRGIALP